MTVIFNKNLHQDFSTEGRSKQLLSSCNMKQGKFQSIKVCKSKQQEVFNKACEMNGMLEKGFSGPGSNFAQCLLGFVPCAQLLLCTVLQHYHKEILKKIERKVKARSLFLLLLLLLFFLLMSCSLCHFASFPLVFFGVRQCIFFQIGF